MRLTYRLRKDISEKLNRLPLSYYDKTKKGEILSRITNDIDTLSQTLNQSLTQMITSVTQLIGILIMMVSISWQMTLIAICTLPVSLLLVAFIVSRSQKQFKLQQEYLGNVNGHIEEMYSGHQANLAFQIKMSTMSGLVHTDANGIGYTSHSFNQFVLFDGDNILMNNQRAYKFSRNPKKYYAFGTNGMLNLTLRF